MYIKENLEIVRQNINNSAKEFNKNVEDIKLIAVSKTKPIDDIIAAINAGAKDFGESYALELKEKHEILAEKGIFPTWHFIGHLQTNKVKYIAPFVSLIHSVDSFKLAEEIDKQAQKNNRIIDILLQVHIAEEDTKSGCDISEIENLAEEVLKLKSINVIGLMTIGTFTYDEVQIRREFQLMKEIKTKISNRYPKIKELSMGMTGDYQIAIEYGATMLRIGSAIFGERIYA